MEVCQYNKLIFHSFNIYTLSQYVIEYHSVLSTILADFNAIFITFEVMLEAENIGCGETVIPYMKTHSF